MTATLVPVLLLCGALLGPHGLVILTQPVLSFLDPAAPVALVVLGIAAAMRIQIVGEEARQHAVSAALQATVTAIVVAAGFLLAPPGALTGGALMPAWTVAALTLGIAAATSVDVEDCILPIAAGGLLLAFTRETSGAGALLITVEGTMIAMVIAASGWLLLSRTSSIDEHRVSTFGSALLLGGAADYLSMSALLFGFTAGGCWQLATSVVAGAHATFSIPVFTIAAGYTVLRVCGKLSGSWIASRALSTTPVSAHHLLIMPGALGVAFALNVVRALGDGFAPALTIVVIGTIASSVIGTLSAREAEA
jgi:hypothetical protein